MVELETKEKIISDVLSELPKGEFSFNEENDSAFDIEQCSKCACCCDLAVGTGGTC